MVILEIIYLYMLFGLFMGSIIHLTNNTFPSFIQVVLWATIWPYLYYKVFFTSTKRKDE